MLDVERSGGSPSFADMTWASVSDLRKGGVSISSERVIRMGWWASTVSMMDGVRPY